MRLSKPARLALAKMVVLRLMIMDFERFLAECGIFRLIWVCVNLERFREEEEFRLGWVLSGRG